MGYGTTLDLLDGTQNHILSILSHKFISIAVNGSMGVFSFLKELQSMRQHFETILLCFSLEMVSH